MDYQGTVIRPPSEHESILLQCTLGCTHNKCTFCGAYKEKPFSLKPESLIDIDIEYARRHYADLRRLFLCDGDVLSLSFDRLRVLLEKIRDRLPWVTRVGSYANARRLVSKTVGELKELRSLGLGIVYMGLESGDDVTLLNVNKGADAACIIEQAQKVKSAGIKVSITVILGLGGTERSQIHAQATGEALTAMDPNQVGALSLMLMENTPLYAEKQSGKLKEISPIQMLQELRTMLEYTTLSSGLFYSNHASNYLPLQLRMPKDKQSGLAMIDAALGGNVQLRPEWMRGL